MDNLNKPYLYNGVLINEPSPHQTKPKIMARMKDKETGEWKKVGLNDVSEIDNKNYFKIPDVEAQKEEIMVQPVKPVEVVQLDGKEKALERYKDLTAQRAWLRPALKGEYIELKTKYGF